MSRPSSRRSDPDRLEAFSDGVMAVLITLMAFDLREPGGGSLRDLGHSVPSLLVYMLSFAFIGIYWNNHHHLLRSTERISGAVMWTNLHLLFWLSLIPVLTKWVADNHLAALPACAYGAAGLGAAIAYELLVSAIVAANGSASEVARALGHDFKGRLSALAYAAGLGLAWVSPWISYGLYVGVSVMWFIPDRRLSRADLDGR
ncbi:MAG: TMEM175 family protein [Acidimicrobiales bacterium]